VCSKAPGSEKPGKPGVVDTAVEPQMSVQEGLDRAGHLIRDRPQGDHDFGRPLLSEQILPAPLDGPFFANPRMELGEDDPVPLEEDLPPQLFKRVGVLPEPEKGGFQIAAAEEPGIAGRSLKPGVDVDRTIPR